jgi:hypothetical protein
MSRRGKKDMQTVSGEDDLYELSLAVPQRNRAGATVTLSAPVSKVRVWTNADKSGTMLIGENQPSKTWTYDDKPPASVFVEAVAASVSMNDIAFTLVANETTATQSVTRPTTQQRSSPHTAYSVQLISNHDNANPPRKIMVGTRVNLEVQIGGPVGGAQLGYSWTIPIDAFENWIPTRDESVLVPLEQPPRDRATQTFAWRVPQLKQVTVAVALGGVDLGTRKLDFEVLDPIVDAEAAHIGISRQNPNEAKIVELKSARVNQPDSAGFVFAAQVKEPEGFNGGQWAFCQVVNSHRKYVLNAVEFPNPINGKLALDSSRPPPDFEYGMYALGVPNPAYVSRVECGQTWHEMNDSPSMAGNIAVTAVDVNDEFETFILYRPSGDHSLWVSLRRVEWHFSATNVWNPLLLGWTAGNLSPAGPVSKQVIEYRTHPIWIRDMSNFQDW